MIISKRLDFILIKFPIFIPIFYGIILYSLPNYETILVFLTLALLAEPHFGATWPFFINKLNKSEILSDKIFYIYIPLLIVILSLILYFKANYFFLLIFFIFNIFHVTRQSLGISKLYIKNKKENIYHIYLISFFSILFFIIGLLRFYLNIISSEQLFLVNLFVIILLLMSSFVYLLIFKYSENLYLFISGSIMFFPICFVEKPIHGIVMCVTMHYMQYLALTYKVIIKRNFKNFNINKLIDFKFIIIVFIYGLLMSVFSFSNQISLDFFQYLIVIPIIGQMLHFYLDSLLWRFSNKHNREVTLKYLKI